MKTVSKNRQNRRTTRNPITDHMRTTCEPHAVHIVGQKYGPINVSDKYGPENVVRCGPYVVRMRSVIWSSFSILSSISSFIQKKIIL